jgi:2-polyprenyl-3-methyl-5-hydroxy-6-metoxy-1,4-benzoquinol methylase
MPQIINCPICGSRKYKTYAARIRENKPHVLRVICQDCGFIFANPQATKEELDFFYSNYYDNHQCDEHPEGWKKFVASWRKEYDSGKITLDSIKTFKLLKEFYTNFHGLRWLEVGAGLGNLSYVADKLGFEVSVTEIDYDAILFIKNSININECYHGDIIDLNLKNNYYDVIVLHHVLEHIIELGKTIKTLHRILKPNGLFIITVPNLTNFGYKLHRILSFIIFQIPTILDGNEHTFGFTPKTLSKILQDNGFEIKRIQTFAKKINILKIYKGKGLKKAALAFAKNIFPVDMICVAYKISPSALE